MTLIIIGAVLGILGGALTVELLLPGSMAIGLPAMAVVGGLFVYRAWLRHAGRRP
jgi:hypothetical protein